MKHIDDFDMLSVSYDLYVCEDCNAETTLKYDNYLKEVTSVSWKLKRI